MSELQIYLVALGVAAILVVLIFNWWQDRRVRRRMQAHMPVVEQDPLLDGGLGTLAESRREPGLAGPESTPLAAAAGPADGVVAEHEEPDPSCEVVIEVTFAGPISAQDLMPLVQSLRSAGRKPVRIFVQDTEGQLSRRLQADVAYQSMHLAVLLANRSGPLSAIEWSQVWNRVQSLADQIEATVEGPDQQTVLEAAARLDDTCAALDTQVGLTVLLGKSRPVAEVTGAARAMGFVPWEGRLAWMGDHGMECFTLSRADGEPFDAGMATVDRLSLLLDVPCSPADPRGFGRMMDVGVELAQRLGADLVDDQNRPVQAGTDASIDERLQVLHAQLEAAGLKAGSLRARRVFS
jgi:hypothetical protein